MKISRLLLLPGLLTTPICAPVAWADILSPLDVPGHVLWLDGDDFDGNGIADAGISGTPITSWVDKSSGQGINTATVTAGAPTLQYGVVGAHNAVHFTSASQDKLDISSLIVGGDYTVFTVVASENVAVSGHVLSGINNAGTDAVLYRTGGGVYRFYSGQTAGNADNGIITRAGATSSRLFGYQISSTGLDTGIFQSVRTNFEAAGTAQLNGVRIGNLDRGNPSNPAQAEAWAGNISEILIYDRTLNSAEIRDVSNYLSLKYNLRAASATGLMTEIETGMVSAGAPSLLSPNSEPVLAGKINAALSANGGLAFGLNYIGPSDPRDFRPYRANDGLYSDAPEGPPPIQEPWIGGTIDSYLGVQFASAMTIDRIGIQDQFAARRNGALIFEYTKDSFSGVPTDVNLGLVPAAVDGLTWQVLDVIQMADGADTRHLYAFDPISDVTGLRVRIESTAAEFAMAELEVWGVPEPGTALLLGLGLCLAANRRRRVTAG